MTDPSPTPPPPAAGGFTAPAPMPGGVPGGGLQLSSPWKRLGAQFLEAVLIIVTLVIGWLIWWVIAWGKGQTPAKVLLKMRCVKLDENRPATWGEMALRELVGKSLLSSITSGITTIIGGVMILADGTNRQALWDKIAGTTVVDDPNNAFGL